MPASAATASAQRCSHRPRSVQQSRSRVPMRCPTTPCRRRPQAAHRPRSPRRSRSSPTSAAYAMRGSPTTPGLDLSGMHFSQRDHSLRVTFSRQRFTHDDIGTSFSSGGRDIRLQAELQPVTAAHSSRGAFGEDGSEPGGSVADEPACSPGSVGSISFYRACARGLLLAGLAFEIGYPILYDKFVRPGVAALAGLCAEHEQFFSAPHIAGW